MSSIRKRHKLLAAPVLPRSLPLLHTYLLHPFKFIPAAPIIQLALILGHWAMGCKPCMPSRYRTALTLTRSRFSCIRNLSPWWCYRARSLNHDHLRLSQAASGPWASWQRLEMCAFLFPLQSLVSLVLIHITISPFISASSRSRALAITSRATVGHVAYVQIQLQQCSGHNPSTNL